MTKYKSSTYKIKKYNLTPSDLQKYAPFNSVLLKLKGNNGII